MEQINLSIIIPVFNERQTVQELLEKVYALTLPNITREFVIVESNSTDGSREIVQRFAEGRPDVKVVLEERPQGKGHALRAGLDHAQGAIVMVQDADLEYDLQDYPKLLAPILAGKADFVLGSRHLDEQGKTTWTIRKFKGRERFYAYLMNLGGIFFHTLFNLLYGTHLSDPTTMYKVFRRDLLQKVHLKGNYFEIDWEIVAKFVRLGYIPTEIPISYQSRSPKEGKKVRFSRDVLKWLKMIVMTRFQSIQNL